jgi:hypothetical protein
MAAPSQEAEEAYCHTAEQTPPNASLQLLPEAGATRRLEAVSCKAGVRLLKLHRMHCLKNMA